MTQQEKDQLLSYFQNPNKKGWSRNERQEFWRKLREYRKSNIVGSTQYREYVFPKFELAILEKTSDGRTVFSHDCNFWNKGEEFKLESADFTFATFLESANFSGCHFEGGAQFYNSFFLDDANFKECVFDEQVVLRHCHFDKRVDFSKSKFNKRILAIESSYFKGETFFHDITVSCNFEMNFSEFEYLEMSYNTFNKSVTVSHCKFKSVFEFIGNNIYDLLIVHTCRFSRDELCLFQDINHERKEIHPRMEFVNIIFHSSFIFRRTNLSETAFYQSDITNIQFKECFAYHGTLIKEDRFVESGHFDALSDSYCQLKRNFENSKNWELSDVAYRREMVMKKKYYHLLAKRKKYFSLYTIDSFLYLIYEQVSGFNRSYTRPLVLLLISSLLLFPGAYMLVEGDTIYNSLVKSLGATLPYFYKVEASISFKGWGLHSTQTLVSSILLAFFVIALRRRFKS